MWFREILHTCSFALKTSKSISPQLHTGVFFSFLFFELHTIYHKSILFTTAVFSGPGRAPGNPWTLSELNGSQGTEQPLQPGPGELSLGYGSSSGPGHGQPGYSSKLECVGEPQWRWWASDYLILLNGHFYPDVLFKRLLNLCEHFEILKCLIKYIFLNKGFKLCSANWQMMNVKGFNWEKIV